MKCFRHMIVENWTERQLPISEILSATVMIRKHRLLVVPACFEEQAQLFRLTGKVNRAAFHDAPAEHLLCVNARRRDAADDGQRDLDKMARALRLDYWEVVLYERAQTSWNERFIPAGHGERTVRRVRQEAYQRLDFNSVIGDVRLGLDA